MRFQSMFRDKSRNSRDLRVRFVAAEDLVEHLTKKGWIRKAKRLLDHV